MHVTGIDEAGRGPLAGPVAVGAVRISGSFNKKFFKGIKDSKQLKEEEKELWFGLLKEARKKGELQFAVSLVSENIIDKKGIAYAIRVGIKRCLAKVHAETKDQIFLDGGIYAPIEFTHQKTIIKGDEKIPVIALASIAAKVTRDVYMKKLSKEYPEYGFHVHKGYGTVLHREAIKKHGPSGVHRRSFLKKLT
ncbi:MAG: rnhB [Parcubacteria group bacterium]|nr:rnhB [Parcubacteria group bacterium]